MTRHQIHYKAAQQMEELENESVDLVVTSPPYPMIEMWDDIMKAQNEEIAKEWEQENYNRVFELMHLELDKVWKECFRVLKEGGTACINIGDATRTLSKNFALYPNHARILSGCLSLGFQNLPNIIWRKQTNAPNKFMGSGTLPPGAYVTLEHEFILILRKGRKREFRKVQEKERRSESAFFWEERNVWFSDLWDVKGTKQKFKDEIRKRSGAYPLEIPYRLINMFSVKGDMVLDPFYGTGTTTLAAVAANRNSVGYEINPGFQETISNGLLSQVEPLNRLIKKRFENHLLFVENRRRDKGEDAFKYENANYGFPVMTRQELKILIEYVREISFKENSFLASYYNEPLIENPSTLL